MSFQIERLKGYFTHYLISGLRGAADVNTEGKITLNGAYQFAFQETLGRTVNSQGGAQHPSYDIELSGTGDVTITDVRQTTAALVLGASLEPRIFVSNHGDGGRCICRIKGGSWHFHSARAGFP